MQRVWSERGGDPEWRAVRRGAAGLEGLAGGLCRSRCLNLSDRWFLERKKSAGVGQAFTRPCEKWDIGVGTQPPDVGLVGCGAYEVPGVAGVEPGFPLSKRSCRHRAEQRGHNFRLSGTDFVAGEVDVRLVGNTDSRARRVLGRKEGAFLGEEPGG